ncbi:MAG: DUF4190 domain-containing protein [Ruminococcus sp.]|nr:DUF4190 domain-containing protein [Ruminococcus sp.]
MDNNTNNYQNNGYQPPVDQNNFQTPQYGAPQQGYNQPQYNAPQQNYQQPQYGAQPNYQQPQYNTTEYNTVPQYGQPQYQPNAYAPMVEKDDSKGMAIASLVCGILSVTCCCGGWLPSILAIIFGVISKNRKKDNNSMALVGIILGAIGVVFSIASIIIMASGTYTDLLNELYYY